MNIKESVFLFVKSKIEQKGPSSFFDKIFKPFLIFLSYFFQFFVFLKNLAYDMGLFKPYKIKGKVISIGNIVAGGTGKTPFTIYLAQKFLSKGYKVAVISRGYGAKKIKKDKCYVLNEKEKSTYSIEEVGDEPYLIHRRLPELYVIIGKDKINSAQMAENLDCDIILLDDGFQSRKVFRDLDIVLLSFDSPLSNGHFLPAGFLRDSPHSLKRADLVVFTNVDSKKACPSIELPCPYIFSSSNISDFIEAQGEDKTEVFGEDKKIAIFCAIANPNSFFKVLSEKGYEIVDRKYFFDHSYFDINFLKKFSLATKEKGAKALICTEKDMVKLPKDISLHLPIFYVQLDHKIIFGKEKLEELLQLK